MNNFFKKLIIINFILLLLFAFSKSYNILNLDNLAFIVAIGFDKSSNNNLKVTFEFAQTSKSGENSIKTEPIFNTIECSSITNALNLMTVYLGKHVNLAHCKIVVFSEEIAKDGISEIIYSLVNDVQIRPSTNIVISKCNAKYYIENSTPSLESLIPKYYAIFPNNSEYTGYTCNATIGDFFNSLSCNVCEPFAILGDINTNNSIIQEEEMSDSPSQNSNASPITQNNTSQNIGVAVFKDDKLVGELNSIETICFLNIRKKIDNFLISIPDPNAQNSMIDIYLKPKTSKIKVSFIGASPYVELNFNFYGKIYTMDKNNQYLNSNTLNLISTCCNKYLENEFSNYLYKTSNILKSDINNIGSYASSKFLTDNTFNDYNWLTNYKNCIFNLKINTNIDTGFLLTQT